MCQKLKHIKVSGMSPFRRNAGLLRLAGLESLDFQRELHADTSSLDDIPARSSPIRNLRLEQGPFSESGRCLSRGIAALAALLIKFKSLKRWKRRIHDINQSKCSCKGLAPMVYLTRDSLEALNVDVCVGLTGKKNLLATLRSYPSLKSIACAPELLLDEHRYDIAGSDYTHHLEPRG